ncbi:uncharacterized protein DUF4367 [Natranaerovirga hydrolytica]|uniref:Uncharacterized protein DUF4367 n=1 Tax=Natranaerovirga hydrolytica TaxID=680378 RepID=A0A4R1MJL3_9FIRM|nr:DUF4367 domain-containing protein [Natranaerovirga hydrolytica]TCK92635.1 uncharacterized protein DUF4367 [Natranaerovirga hydrolytica]
MKEQSEMEKERLEKLEDVFLYNMGYENISNVCCETEQLLKEYKNIKVPESLNNWFVDFNKKQENKIKYEKLRTQIKHFGKQIAIFLVIITIIFSAVTVSVEAFRIRFFNMVIETTKQFTAVNHKESLNYEYINELPSNWDDFYGPIVIPEGYQLLRAFDVNNTKYIIFKDIYENELRFLQGNLSADYQLDSEDGKVMEVDINGNKGIIIEKDEVKIINWNDNNNSFYIQGNLGKSTLLEMAESVIKK